MNSRQSGYSLVELLITVLLFSFILGILFTAFLNLRQTETERQASTQLTRIVDGAFSELVLAVEQASIRERVVVIGDGKSVCQEVNGYYVTDEQGNWITGQHNVLGLTKRLVIIGQIPRIAQSDQAYEWVKKEYLLKQRKDRENKDYTTLVERTVHMFSDDSSAWPNPINSCDAITNPWTGGQVEERDLSPDFATIEDFSISFQSPDSNHTNAYVTINVVARDRNRPNTMPLILHTTITPKVHYDL